MTTTLTWRERWAALNRWRWREFRTGLGMREYAVVDVRGLAEVVGEQVKSCGNDAR